MSKACGIILALLCTAAAWGAEIEPFFTSKLHIVHLRVSEAGWKTMQPTKRSLWSELFGAPATRPASREAYHEGDRLAPSPIGNQYAYVKADVEFDGARFVGAGLRFKGNSSYWASSGGYHRPMKIDFGRFEQKGRFLGLKELNLHNNTLDPSEIREVLSYRLFNDAGVPAPRASLAAVYLTIDGKFQRKFIGLYAVVEEVDKTFLKERFGDGSGLVLKPENLMGGIGYRGDTWAHYQKDYRPKREPSAREAQRVIELARLISLADDATFRRRIGEMLDVDAFLHFIAMNAVLSNLDSYLSFGHNFYLYLDPRTDRFVFVPWDLNLSLGTFNWLGAPEDQMRLSIRRPYLAGNRLIERLLAVDEHAAKYRAYLRHCAADVLDEKKIARQVEELEERIRESRALEKSAGEEKARTKRDGDVWGRPPEIRAFLAGRSRNIQDQLAGRDSGYEPKFKVMGIFGKAAPDEPAPPPAPQPGR